MWPALTLSAINMLLHGLAAAPVLEEDFKQILQLHWSKDHVQDAVQGIKTLGKIVADVETAFAGSGAAVTDPVSTAPKPDAPPVVSVKPTAPTVVGAVDTGPVM